jgi:hypothetical protein
VRWTAAKSGSRERAHVPFFPQGETQVAARPTMHALHAASAARTRTSIVCCRMGARSKGHVYHLFSLGINPGCVRGGLGLRHRVLVATD